MTIEKNGNSVYDQRHELSPREGTDVDGVSILEPWMGTGSDFELEVVVPSVGTETFSTTEFDEQFDYEYDCVPLDVHIERDRIESYYGTNGCSEV